MIKVFGLVKQSKVRKWWWKMSKLGGGSVAVLRHLITSMHSVIVVFKVHFRWYYGSACGDRWLSSRLVDLRYDTVYMSWRWCLLNFILVFLFLSICSAYEDNFTCLTGHRDNKSVKMLFVLSWSIYAFKRSDTNNSLAFESGIRLVSLDLSCVARFDFRVLPHWRATIYFEIKLSWFP